MDKLKQVILVRRDLNLSRGKLASQVAHASVEAVLNSDTELVEEWRKQGMSKIILGVENLYELEKLINRAKSKSIITSVVWDEGLTEIKKGTVTCKLMVPKLIYFRGK
jgi:PTH2 family peptidyl-tRNA hydrolase